MGETADRGSQRGAGWGVVSRGEAEGGHRPMAVGGACPPRDAGGQLWAPQGSLRGFYLPGWGLREVGKGSGEGVGPGISGGGGEGGQAS